VDADTALLTVSYDLLILDLGLPKLSGLDVLKRCGRATHSCRC
jgi:two-component system OmpR family response regulator